MLIVLFCIINVLGFCTLLTILLFFLSFFMFSFECPVLMASLSSVSFFLFLLFFQNFSFFRINLKERLHDSCCDKIGLFIEMAVMFKHSSSVAWQSFVSFYLYNSHYYLLSTCIKSLLPRCWSLFSSFEYYGLCVMDSHEPGAFVCGKLAGTFTERRKYFFYRLS